jgi:L-lactate dehydrogenase (cytochrome)
MQVRWPGRLGEAGGLQGCFSVEDLRSLSQRRLPKVVFDYVDGGADEEVTLRANRAAFQTWEFLPRILKDVTRVDLSVEVFGRLYGMPLGLCPTGYTRMVHPEGEIAVAKAAAARRVPYTLSTAGTTVIEEVGAVGHEDLWFQLFVLKDRGLARSLVERAAQSGFRALEVTVDTSVSGRKVRDLRNGLTIPPLLRLGSLVDIGLHFRYWSAMVRAPALQFANLVGLELGSRGRMTAARMADVFDPSLTWDGIAEVRGWWSGPMLLKGLFSCEDARRAVALGVDGLHLSNHGGRQLDRCVPTAELVREVRQAVGDDATIVVDSGIRHGADVAVAIALGADLCAVGRPYLYGLSVAGERGVCWVIDLFADQLRRTMRLLGVSSLAELRRHGAQLLRRRSRDAGAPCPSWPFSHGSSQSERMLR